MTYRILIAAVLCLSCFSFSVNAQEQLSIPRFASLKMSEVNLRTGPGNRFPIKYVYKMKYYPVEIIDEYELWRQIRERDGTIGWVHRRMLSGARYILMTKDDNLLKKPEEKSKIIAIAQKGTLAQVEACPFQNDYCQVVFQYNDRKLRGWVNKESFYGVYPNEVIK